MPALAEPAAQPLVVLAMQALATLRTDTEQMEGHAEAQLGVGPDVLLPDEAGTRCPQLVECLEMTLLGHVVPREVKYVIQ